ncbi:AAA family ATPase [Candidatus Daviesbacteria bacterium RIFCSPHIGHO2_12_FULL_37_11]|uniref:AAA family ATPase n=1 Tax=Candidatus Daviesbacteria bacterium RIFCSPHIGHO2_12_FULL_37_11 TaxID=1797777 RepID=A0A1F5KBW5_9BACT|nr:MAG: AAA family ATPase [Candidatus Daviesbacteria bacterium GWA1_38_6]OGE16998.1 MAG: AAA family ATPase [Candidatus Daviesbacteria bacterium RIFCSPHIGHO2_01_FULL_37_27]OGE38300.1 MAG: AAA family ATPase [Candidatus Daviesbacteria bacterium RIFCSPHIGHO2_12_FULL_37_11]OGE46260.1 MAG: AAA family ATPase [Candidatus Daviesbacteria bacterium RIFCSPLOWO2_01_FULL_37_10]
MTPLSDRMRPNKLSEIIGQKHILSNDSLLTKSIKSGQIFSMIFWGPPGVGKTTLARVIAKETQVDFLEFSAVNTCTAELKKIFGELDPARQTIVFIDEIHRFSKSQQDAFLPFVERGVITLIGATTENPSFEIIAPLLSRSRVFVLNRLTKEELTEVAEKALTDTEFGLGKFKAKISDKALEFLIEESNGDARKILNTLEIAVNSLEAKVEITEKTIEEAIQKKALMYDKNGEEHYNTISAFIKSMRASNPDAALYYLARMIEAGEDPLFIARRMVIFASEDIGMAQPTAIVIANEVFKACEVIGYPECTINLAHGTVYLAKAKKDRSAYNAYFKAVDDIKNLGNLPIPLHLKNAPTKLMKELGYGKDYEMYPDKDKSLLPEKLKGKKYFIEKSED